MRLDKFLKVSRLIKRRTLAKEFCDTGRVLVNDRPSKPATELVVGDVLEIRYGQKRLRVEVLELRSAASVTEARNMYQVIAEIQS